MPSSLFSTATKAGLPGIESSEALVDRDMSARCAVGESLAAGISSNCTGAGSGGIRAVVRGVTGLTGAPVPSLPEADVTVMTVFDGEAGWAWPCSGRGGASSNSPSTTSWSRS